MIVTATTTKFVWGTTLASLLSHSVGPVTTKNEKTIKANIEIVTEIYFITSITFLTKPSREVTMPPLTEEI